MKTLLMTAFLFLAACTSQNDSPVDTPQAEVQSEKEELTVLESSAQVLMIQDVRVEVSKTTIDSNLSGPWDVFMIQTPHQKLSFGVSQWDSIISEKLSSEMLALAQEDQKGRVQVFKLSIETKLEEFAVKNVLALDRCISVSIRPQIIELLRKPRPAIYFGLLTETSRSIPKALRWDMEKKEFTGFVTTDSMFTTSGAVLNDQYLLLAPNMNVGNEEGTIFEDSAFLSLDRLNNECDSRYSAFIKSKPRDQYDPNDNYEPAYDPRTDHMDSRFVSEKIDTLSKAFGATMGIYWDEDYLKLKKELVNKAKANPLFLKFTQGQ